MHWLVNFFVFCFVYICVCAGVNNWRIPKTCRRSLWCLSLWMKLCRWSCALYTAWSITHLLTCSRRSSWWTTTATAVRPHHKVEDTRSYIIPSAVWGQMFKMHSWVVLSCRSSPAVLSSVFVLVRVVSRWLCARPDLALLILAFYSFLILCFFLPAGDKTPGFSCIN